MRRSCVLLSLFVSVVLASPRAAAQVTDLHVCQFFGTLSDGTDVVSNVLSIDFTGQYTGSQILVELDTGSVVNVDFFGGANNVAPTQAAVGFVPDLAFDTFVAQGGLRAENNVGGQPAFGGGAVNLDPTEVSAVFDSDTKISQAYNPAPGQFIFDQTQFVVAQITFTADANGTMKYFASANGEFFVEDSLTIINGRWPLSPGPHDDCIPEPTAAATLLAGALAWRRERNRRTR